MNAPEAVSAPAAEREAQKAIMTMFNCLDDGDYDGVAAGFADDGVWVRMNESLTGPAAVRAAIATRPRELKTRHLISNMLAQMQPDGSVEARYTITVFDALYEASGPAPLGLPSAIFACRDRVVRTDRGWRFALRHPMPVFRRP